ncbi:MAG: hypothetical protein KDB79_11290 [Acidobacteria bacterium]|nr:hypothetical protein [Acidobacteriota bacterium]
MITGYNTDVKYEGITYHVQTEDKGLETPLILSLVYQNGTILASKRSTYEDLIADKFDEKVLAVRLQRQHKLMCAAVQSGRIEDLKRMTLRNASDAKSKNAPKTVSAPVEDIRAAVEEILTPQVQKNLSQDIPLPDILLPKDQNEVPLSSSIEPEPETDQAAAQETVWDIPMIDGVEIVEDDDFFEEGFVLSPDAIRIVSEFAESEVGFGDELKIKFLADYTFRSGDKKNVNLLVCRGEKEVEVENANVMIKVLGASFRPMIFHSKTDKHGVATVFVKLPMFRSGRAALLVRASTDNEETELRKVIHHS